MENTVKTTFERIAQDIANLSGTAMEQIKPESVLAELGMDSLDAVELVMCIEEDFGIELSDESAEGAKTVQDLVAMVDAAVNVMQRPDAPADEACCGDCSGQCGGAAQEEQKEPEVEMVTVPRELVERMQTQLLRSTQIITEQQFDLRAAESMMALLVHKLGGAVSVTVEEANSIRGYSVDAGPAEDGSFAFKLIAPQEAAAEKPADTGEPEQPSQAA